MKKLIFRKENFDIRILARPRVADDRFCLECLKPVRWFAPEEAMAFMNVSLREIFQLVERREIHFAENEAGFLLVCAESLTTKKEK